MSPAMPDLSWREFGADAFAEAKRLGRPVVLLLTATWCRHSKALRALLETDADLRRTVDESYVPVHADKDQRPDVDERYNQGGWPTLAILDADGTLLAAG